MGMFHASIMEAMKCLRDEIKSVKNTALEGEVDQISTSTLKPGTSKQIDLSLSPSTHSVTQQNTHPNTRTLG